MQQQSAGQITHGSRMDHFYAIDATNGFTYIGHCEQTISATGLLSLTHPTVAPTAELEARSRAENKEYGLVVIEAYERGHSKHSTIALGPECRAAIHMLDAVLRERQRGHQGGVGAGVMVPLAAPGAVHRPV